MNFIQTLVKVVVGLLAFVLLGAFFTRLSPSKPASSLVSARGVGEVMKEGTLKDTWERFDIPVGKGCDVYTNVENTLVAVRPNGDYSLAYNMDPTGIGTFASTGEPVGAKINRRILYILYRGEGSNVGTPYVVLCW